MLMAGTHQRRMAQKKEHPTYIGHHINLAVKQSKSHKAATPETFSSIVHLIAKNTPEQTRTPWKPPTDLSKPTISSLDSLVM
jgi:hypothetical protein